MEEIEVIDYGCDARPREGQIVFVGGGVAQYRDGVFYTGMEDPRYERPIQWNVTWWLPTDGEGIYLATRKWKRVNLTAIA